MDAKLDFMRDLFDAVYRVICKKLARDEKGDFVVHEYSVEAVVSTFYRESWGDESEEERGM